MKKIFLLALIFHLSLQADCFYWEGGIRTGYRQDQLRNKIYNPENETVVLFRESFNRVRSLQVEAFTKFRFWWLELGGDADWSWVESGNVQSTFFAQEILPSGESNFIPAKFQSDADGNLWDVFGTGGIRVCLYDCNDRFFGVTPIGGYSIHHQSLKRKNIKPESLDLGSFTRNGVVSNPTLVKANNSKRFKRTFYGPFVGGNLYISHCYFTSSFGYSYHWMNLHQKAPFSNTFLLFLENESIEEETFINENVFNPSNNKGHRAWTTLGYRLCNSWRVGLQGTYFLINTKKKTSKSTDTTALRFITPSSPAQMTLATSRPKEKAKWQTFSILFEAAFEF